jgi:DNA-binding NarL/FixJ family response regulator
LFTTEGKERLIRVFVVHEFRLMCNIICAALNDEPPIQIVGFDTTFEQALAHIPGEAIDVVLLSSRLPGHGTLKLTKALTQIAPSVKILVLGIAETKEKVLRYIESGATGYVHRDNSVEDLVAAIGAAYNGRAFISPEIAAALIERISNLARRFSRVGSTLPDTIKLTTRQLEILELLEQNLSNKEIADRLVIEVGTVKNHIHHILSKLGVTNREDAASLLALLREETDNQG